MGLSTLSLCLYIRLNSQELAILLLCRKWGPCVDTSLILKLTNKAKEEGEKVKALLAVTLVNIQGNLHK